MKLTRTYGTFAGNKLRKTWLDDQCIRVRPTDDKEITQHNSMPQRHRKVRPKYVDRLLALVAPHA